LYFSLSRFSAFPLSLPGAFMIHTFIRFSTITLIAFMVWLYAEGATRKQHTVTLNVIFVAPQGQRLLIEPTLHSVTATVRCATSQLQQVKDLALEPIPIEVADTPGRPERTINLDQQFSVHERINRMGIVIERVEPSQVNLRIEALKTLEIPITLVTPPDLELAVPAQFAAGQNKAMLELPSSAESQIKGMELQARLDANLLAGVVPGVLTDREIDVTLPPGMAALPNVSYQPRRVKVSFTVKKKEDEYTVGLVPVLLNIAPNLARQYNVEVDQENLLLRDVKVKGPSDVIARIRAGTLKLEALLRMDPEDLEKKIHSKLPELRLPPGVTVESTLPLIKLTITKREAIGS